jgi:cyclophilin family peptidyl-prolyl cis-trans isomerase
MISLRRSTSALLEISLGDIVVDLCAKELPFICTTFQKLCKLKYYIDCHIFPVIKVSLLRRATQRAQVDVV